ncbi:hypothetical protein [Methanocaldococcus sp.]
MKTIAIEPLFGTSFFERLKELIENAKKRILIASAFLDRDVYHELMRLKTDLPIYTIVRDDSNFRPYKYSIVVPRNIYHGKVYIVDNTIIVGSHNLIGHSIRNEGEFSIMIIAESETIDALLFSILYNIFVRSSSIKLNYINENTTYLYNWGCPFCGQDIPDPFSIVECPWYGEGDAKYVSQSDCKSYDGEGSCKGCFAHQYPVTREFYFCDDRGCGLGIDPKYGKFIKHAINPPSNEYTKRAERLIEIFNGLCQYISPKSSAKMLRDLNLLGKVFIIDNIDRGVSDYLISLNFFKKMMVFFIEDFINSVSKYCEKKLDGDELY